MIARYREMKIPKSFRGDAAFAPHASALTFHPAEVAVPRALFAAILGRIGRLRAAPGPG